MSRIQAYTYRLPFKQAFVTAVGRFSEREGIILHFDADGISALGEIAPLTGFSNESLDDCITLFKQYEQEISDLITEKQPAVFYSRLEEMQLPPSMEFGIDMLRHDFLSKSQSLKFSAFFDASPSEQISLNAVSGLTDADELMQKTKHFIQQGFRTLKLKVGRDIHKETEILKKLRDTYPELSIRLDANGAWTPGQAAENLRVLEAFEPEFIEQPVRGISELAEIRNESSIPIAADEDFRSEEDLNEIIQKEAADILVFKPMMMGHFRRLSVTKSRSDAHKIKAVFSSSLESGVGRKMSAILACFFGDPILAHGFSTDTLFKEDLFGPKADQAHRFSLAGEYGIGIEFSQLSTSMMEGI
jgi:o-succinylbenzoate synthase